MKNSAKGLLQDSGEVVGAHTYEDAHDKMRPSGH